MSGALLVPSYEVRKTLRCACRAGNAKHEDRFLDCRRLAFDLDEIVHAWILLEANDGEIAKEIVREWANDLRTNAKSRALLLGEALNRVEGKVKDEIEHSGAVITKVVLLDKDDGEDDVRQAPPSAPPPSEPAQQSSEVPPDVSDLDEDC